MVCRNLFCFQTLKKGKLFSVEQAPIDFRKPYWLIQNRYLLK